MRSALWFSLGAWFGWLSRGELASAFWRGLVQ